MKLEVFQDDEWVDEVSRRWISSVAASPALRLCLPTGETPRPVYTRSAPTIDLSSATVFLLDEFSLPANSPARCDAMLRRDLLDSLTHPPLALEALDVHAEDADAECLRFDQLVNDGGLDLTLLGLGGNGHLGLNEPGTANDSPTRVVTLDKGTTLAASRYGEDASPTRGMTLGLQAILDSHEIWLLVTGSHKAETLRRLINGPIGPDLPASFLRDHPNTIVLADKSAAISV